MERNRSYPSKDPMFRLGQEMRIRNFSPKTIKAYLYYNKELLRFASKFSDEINRQDIRDYLDYLFSSGRSASTVSLAVNALKFYFEKILARKFFISDLGIKHPKKPKKLPVVLSKIEVVKMMDALENIKHKLLIQIMYGSGLRVSETVNLRINDIDFGRNIIHIKGAKGRKDRISIVSKITLDNIDKYLREFQPLIFLFESYEAGSKINIRSVQKIVFIAAKKAGIAKNVSAHSLRHSFATSLLEAGTDIRYIQELLGHARLETTQIYTKVSDSTIKNIESPI
jgi:integrase/recombinase XerD